MDSELLLKKCKDLDYALCLITEKIEQNESFRYACSPVRVRMNVEMIYRKGYSVVSLSR